MKKLSIKSTGGTATMKRSGQKPILIYLTAAEHLQIRIAAAQAGKPMSHFVKELALAACGK